MITSSKILELYKTISSDLLIKQYSDEDTFAFNCRIVYSALAKWILCLFCDREFEDDSLDQVSKSHVTITAKDVLSSFKKIDVSLYQYFNDDDFIVKKIEDCYLRIGYIKSGNYNFKFQDKKLVLNIADKALDIDGETSIRKMRGIGYWAKQKDNEVSLKDFLLIKDDAKSVAVNLINKLKYDTFDLNVGKNEIYNCNLNRWEIVNLKNIKTDDYGILKIDDGLDYKIVKVINDSVYVASLPTIYKKGKEDFYFYHEVWRIILGICALNNKSVKCKIISYNKEYIKIKIGGYIMPVLEESLFMTMARPLKSCTNINEYITDYSMKKAVIELLSSLSIDIIEEDYYAK